MSEKINVKDKILCTCHSIFCSGLFSLIPITHKWLCKNITEGLD
ncbi:hypothetical protein D026_4301 [Vibrio parahaemolyticus 605]|nr:conserved hypothetical protein [Vibrio parahaemolyticus AN-5034]EQL91608.1 hypothetical protein D035_4021 [Vibrio parahaemolyticus VP250]EQL99376.1 hypothetical protein D036_1908 [Vibrio parahaemolyticus VP232]EQM00586.1 hypothetical protein D040_0978 [Vibrio parahaemolyticus NIHCB0603]EQM01080.1 hypothetical protein D019_3039 [Vibrio parahaemolyticus VP2007-095]EQM11353.1 hypothetical protein D045_1918 [Vibrio parahaemolyticus VP-NY4]EQM43121.1 hypothetical protein D025_2966 [Vibrio parah